MKKLMTIAAIAGAIFLTGCTPTTVETVGNSKLDAVIPTLSVTERAMLDRYVDAAFSSRYDKTYTAMARSRIDFGVPINERSDTEIPFCDVISQVVKDEKDASMEGKWYSLNGQWETTYGITLEEQCGKQGAIDLALEREIAAQAKIEQLKAEAKVIQEEQIAELKVEKIEESVVVIDDNVLISPALVRELRESVKDCGRAKHELLNTITANEALTVTHYDKIQGLVLQCEMHLLETELNQ